MKSSIQWDGGLSDVQRELDDVIRAGSVFTRMTVIGEAPRRRGRRVWRCVCACGEFRDVVEASLKRGDVKSCGCLRRERIGASNRQHGLSRTPTHTVWAAMRARCNNPNHEEFHRYGGRGIRICDRWNDFANFIADMGERPPGKSIDRFPNNDGNYEPGNCRWATRQEQGENTSVNRLVTAFGETKPASVWAADARCAVSRKTLYDRLRHGWEHARAITEACNPPGGRPWKSARLARLAEISK